MKTANTAIRRPAALAIALALALPALAQAAPQDLPDAAQLVERNIQALGGEAKVAQATRGTATGRFKMPAAGLEAPIRVSKDGQGNVASQVELPGMGEILTGINNGVVWAMDPFQGPRILEGAEAAEQLDDATADGMLRRDSKVAAMRTTGTGEYAGKACYRVEIQWRSGRQSWDCYGRDDGRLVASGGTSVSPAGEIETVVVVSEYGERGGLTLPVRTEVQAMGQTQIITIDAFDPAVPAASAFQLPAAIQALAAE